MNEAEIFALLKASSDSDVLEHFPKRYQDLHETPPQSAYQPDQEIVASGTVGKITSIRAPLSIIRFELHSASGVYNCAIFNQPFYSRTLKTGRWVLVVASYKVRTKSFIVKSLLNAESPYLKTRLRPIYSLPKHLSQSSFSSCVERILDQRSLYIHEVLPASLRRKYRLESRYQAFRDVHQPQDYPSLNRGLRVFKYEEALKYCLYTAIVRQRRSTVKKIIGEPLPLDRFKDFVAALPYRLTGDQQRAVEEIVGDMTGPSVMYRLLQGDVGTGKTLVALLALYANFLRGVQGALLAPTLILAEQHYASASRLFKDLPVSVALLTTKTKANERRRIFAGLADGSIDIAIGTHALLTEQLEFHRLGLAIIDEQQNFGVEQRNRLIEKGLTTDLLMMTATPIPRTLSKVVNADLDVSTLAEFPSKRRSVTSKVVQSVDPIIGRAIERALQLERQVFVVAPKIVETETGSKVAVETVFAQMAREYGEERVALLHGRMKEDERTAIYDDFVSGRKLILVATSIVEVGLDIQRACLMIIYSANTFGLSSLHQLRGRIGRSGENAMALLVYDGDEAEARAALDFLAAHDDGFLIAEYDLKKRGSGSLTGTNQSGDSVLQAANFVDDQRVFEAALQDAAYIVEHLDDQELFLYYSQVAKSLDEYHFD